MSPLEEFLILGVPHEYLFYHRTGTKIDVKKTLNLWRKADGNKADEIDELLNFTVIN